MKILRLFPALFIIAAGAVPSGVFAIDLNNNSGETSSGDFIRVGVPELPSITEFDLLSSHQTADGVYEVNNGNIRVKFAAGGIGEARIADQRGNILWTGNKTVGGKQEFDVNISLPNGIGLYVLTASIDNGSEAASAELQVRWVPLDDGGIDVPNTGSSYLYLGGYAVPDWWLAVIIMVVVYIVWTVLYMRHEHKREEGKSRRAR